MASGSSENVLKFHHTGDVPALDENTSEVKIETCVIGWRNTEPTRLAPPVEVMDFVGLVMENFDAIGRIRNVNSDHILVILEIFPVANHKWHNRFAQRVS